MSLLSGIRKMAGLHNDIYSQYSRPSMQSMPPASTYTNANDIASLTRRRSITPQEVVHSQFARGYGGEADPMRAANLAMQDVAGRAQRLGVSDSASYYNNLAKYLANNRAIPVSRGIGTFYNFDDNAITSRPEHAGNILGPSTGAMAHEMTHNMQDSGALTPEGESDWQRRADWRTPRGMYNLLRYGFSNRGHAERPIEHQASTGEFLRALYSNVHPGRWDDLRRLLNTRRGFSAVLTGRTGPLAPNAESRGWLNPGMLASVDRRNIESQNLNSDLNYYRRALESHGWAPREGQDTLSGLSGRERERILRNMMLTPW